MRGMRSRKEQRMDRQLHYNGLEITKVSDKAKEDFERPAYSARQLIQKQVPIETSEE